MKKLLFFTTLFFFPLICLAQSPIDDINVNYEDIDDTSDNYTAGGVDYNFNVGPENDLILESITIGGEEFVPVRLANRLIIARVDNPEVQGNKQLMFYEQESESAEEINLKPGFQNTMEEVLVSPVVNRGTDNVFGNQGDPSGNNNNIERLDFIFDDGLVVPPDPAQEGFTILERGGNDAFIIAPILSLDENGDPEAFGTVVEIATTGWGASSISIVTEVMSSPTPEDDLESTTTVGSQPIAGVFISFDDFGLNSGDTIFGYSLAGGDVNYSTPDDLLDVENESIFPTNTSSTSGAEGGLDMIAGGSFFTSNPVDANVELTGGECWRMLTSPVNTTYANLLSSLWTQGVTGANYSGGEPNVFLWPNSLSGEDSNETGWIAPASLQDPIPAGTGFIISVFGDDNYDGIDDGFPKTISISGTGYSGDVTPELNSTTDGWTLVGNPYDEPVDFSSLTTNDLTEVAYVYDRNADGGAGGWRSTDGSIGDVWDGIVAPFQGFFVQNDGAAPALTFTEASQTTGGQFYGKQAHVEEYYLRLELTGEDLANSAWIKFSENGNTEYMRGDAWQLAPFANDFAFLATRKTGTDLLDIAHFPHTEHLEIPLEAETTRPGNYTISMTNMEIPAGMNLIFVDRELDVELPITEGFSYSFTLNQPREKATETLIAGCSDEVPGQFTPQKTKAKSYENERFSILMDGSEVENELPADISLEQNYPNPFNPSTVISYQLPESSEVRLEVFDMAGRLVTTLVDGQVEAGSHNVTFDGSNLSSGVYLYRFQAGEVNLTRKLTLIK